MTYKSLDYDIENPDDWYHVARHLIPALPKYADRFALSFDDERAAMLFEKKNHLELWTMFEKLWEDLPDTPAIRTGPFFDLCDVCSEYWVFGEGEYGEEDEE